MTPDELRAARERIRPLIDGWADLREAPDEALTDIWELAKANVREHPADAPPLIWTDEACFALNSQQHRRDRHPYTCGNDSRHRPLIASRQGWRCADCDYQQAWAHAPA